MDEPHILVNTLYKDKKAKRKSGWFKNIYNHFNNLSPQNYALLLLITLVTILTVVTNYLRSSGKYSQVTQNNLDSPSLSNAWQPDNETVNWQTYRNDEYKFSFKIPSNWIVTNIVRANDQDPNLRVAFGPNKIPNEWSAVHLSEDSQKPPVFIIIYTKENKNYYSKFVSRIERIGEVGFEDGYLDNIKGVDSGLSVSVERNDYVFELYFSEPERSIADNQILSTFKFLDQECPGGQELQQCKLGQCCCPIGALCD